MKIGVSDCLLGSEVRFNKGHKHQRYLTETMGDYFDYVPVCPEVAAGMGVPRDPIRLVATDKGTRALGVKDSSVDVSDGIRAYAHQLAPRLKSLTGFIFMKDSPSCGVYSVKLYNQKDGVDSHRSRGLFSEIIMQAMPWLPVEEGGRLNDAVLRENFMVRVFAHHDWQTTVAPALSRKKIIDFYSRYKYLVMAHHYESYKTIGRYLAKDMADRELIDVANEFLLMFMQALEHKATRKTNTNALMHLRGYIRDLLGSDDSDEMSETIDAYRRGEIPMIVPVRLMRHYLMKADDDYLKQQVFWQPYPEKLGLRNHI